MKTGLRKAWLWTKLVLILLVVAWLAFFFSYNSWNQADEVWLIWGGTPRFVPVSLIIVVTAVISVVVFFLGRKVLGVFQQLRKLREDEQAERRAREIDARVRQVEQKLSTPQAPPAGEPDKNNAGSGQ